MVSKIFKWLPVALFILGLGYSIFGIVHFKWMYHSAENPKAEFLVTGNLSADTSLIIFTAYPCGYCKELYPILSELKEVRKDIRFVTHPIAFGGGETERLARIALAAGLQRRFWEMHTALMEHPQYVVTDVFVEETAAVYGLNIDQLNRDIRSKTVDKLLKKSDKSINAAGLYSTPSLMIKDKVYTISGESLPKLKDLLDLIAQAEK